MFLCLMYLSYTRAYVAAIIQTSVGVLNKQPDESINNPEKAQTSMAASGTEEESAHHQVALVQNLLTFTT